MRWSNNSFTTTDLCKAINICSEMLFYYAALLHCKKLRTTKKSGPNQSVQRLQSIYKRDVVNLHFVWVPQRKLETKWLDVFGRALYLGCAPVYLLVIFVIVPARSLRFLLIIITIMHVVRTLRVTFDTALQKLQVSQNTKKVYQYLNWSTLVRDIHSQLSIWHNDRTNC